MLYNRLSTVVGILCILLSPSATYAKDLDYHNLLIAYMATTGDTVYTKNVEDWMKAFRPQIWSQYQHDEFALDERKTETRETMTKDVSSFDKNDPFGLNIRVQFGEYNFEKEQFELNPFSTSQYYSFDSPIIGSLPPRIMASFTNPDFVDGLPMKKDVAKRFLDARKSGGYVDRDLIAVIKATVQSASADYKIKLKIVGVTLLDQKNSNRVLYEYKPQQQ